MAAAEPSPQPDVVETKPREPGKAPVREFAPDAWDALVTEVAADNAELLRRLSKLRCVRIADVVFPSVGNVERAHDVALANDGGLAGL